MHELAVTELGRTQGLGHLGCMQIALALSADDVGSQSNCKLAAVPKPLGPTLAVR